MQNLSKSQLPSVTKTQFSSSSVGPLLLFEIMLGIYVNIQYTKNDFWREYKGNTFIDFFVYTYGKCND